MTLDKKLSIINSIKNSDKEEDLNKIVEFAKDKDFEVREFVAQILNHKHTNILFDNPFVLLSQDSFSQVREEISRNYYTPTEILEYLADDNELKVVLNVAINSKTPREILEKLYARGEEFYPYLAQNINISKEILKKMILNGGVEVAINATHNIVLDNEIASTLLDMYPNDNRIKKGLIANYKIGNEVLRVLEKDENAIISKFANNRLKKE